jgi:hypothetical protein
MEHGTISTNVYPTNSDGSEVHGVSVNISTAIDISPGFNDGQRDMLLQTQRRELVMPPLWALAHAYIESDSAKEFLDKRLVVSSSGRNVIRDRGIVHIGHGLVVDDETRSYKVSDDGSFLTNNTLGKSYESGRRLNSSDYPSEEMPLDVLVKSFPEAAKSLFLMNNGQLRKLLERAPKFDFDPDRPAVQGTVLADSTGSNGVRPYSFGFMMGGTPEDRTNFFGATVVEYTPRVSYPIRFGWEDEIRVTFEPQEFRRLAMAIKGLEKPFSNTTKSEVLAALYKEPPLPEVYP